MDWTTVGTIITNEQYTYTPVVTGTLFKLKHITESLKKSSLKIAIRQVFEDNGSLALFDYKLINCKVEQDILLFSLPRGLTNRKLAMKRVDNLLEQYWTIEIEQLDIVEDGVNLPVTISDLVTLQLQLDAIQTELTLKALDIELDTHTANLNNPHGVTATQIGAEIIGSAVNAVTAHESTTNHPIATESDRGMMAATDKLKLNAIDSNATANESNAFLLSRNNHQGTQLISTVAGLQSELASKALDLDLDSHTANAHNPHGVTAVQIGADPASSAVNAVTSHEGTTNHPMATSSAKGMMAGTDKSKLDGIEAGATANQSNAFLLARANQNGTQPISTVEGLQTVISNFVNLTTSQVISGVKSFNNLVYLGQNLISNSYISAKNYYLGNSPLNVELLRPIATVNNFCTDIGYFDIPNGGVCFRLSLIVSDESFSVAKTYAAISIYTNSDTGWLKLVPIKESVYFGFNNCDIDIRMHLSKTYLRARRSGGNGSSGTAIVRLEFTGSSNTYFEETYNTTIDTNVTSVY
jgi:hypothetical protein